MREQTPKRYDLITNYRCGSSIEEMELADDGEWVRWESVEAELSALRAEQTRLREALEAAVRGIDDVAAQASLCAHHVVPTEQQRTWLRSEVRREAVAVQRMIRAALSSTPTPETTP